jgi:Uma2 family endonuclease
MKNPANRAATYADLLAASDLLIAEILFGRLVTHRRGDPRHNMTLGLLSRALVPVVLDERPHPQSWICLRRVELHLGRHVVVPDLAAWRRWRLTPFPQRDWIDVAPDWACEVLSPETERRDRGEKRIVYAKAGVRHLWLVDPASRTLEAFEYRGGKWLLLDVFRDDAYVAVSPFADVPFSLDLLWRFKSPSTGASLTAHRTKD